MGEGADKHTMVFKNGYHKYAQIIRYRTMLLHILIICFVVNVHLLG